MSSPTSSLATSARSGAASTASQTGRPMRPAAPAAPATPVVPQPQAPRPAAPAQGASQTCQLTDTASGRTWRIGVDKTTIGREQASADLILPDTNVSRRHAELLRTPQGWALRDLNSTNGTRVNGQRVTQALLHDGDTVSMGLIQLEFREL